MRGVKTDTLRQTRRKKLHFLEMEHSNIPAKVCSEFFILFYLHVMDIGAPNMNHQIKLFERLFNFHSS